MTVTVPVQREEYVLVREPVPGSGTSDRSECGEGSGRLVKL